MKETLSELSQHIAESLPTVVENKEEILGELVIEAKAEGLPQLVAFLHDDASCSFKMLIDIAGVDYPSRANRFDVVYHFLSTKHNQRIRVKVQADEVSPIPSICELYPAAGWYEREVWDMYGVMFSDNPDLRRILTDYGFDGHPQRKDFPLTGYVELRYDEEQKRVVYEPVKLNQAFRDFDYLSPWEGPEGYEEAPKEEGAA